MNVREKSKGLRRQSVALASLTMQSVIFFYGQKAVGDFDLDPCFFRFADRAANRTFKSREERVDILRQIQSMLEESLRRCRFTQCTGGFFLAAPFTIFPGALLSRFEYFRERRF